MSIRHSLLTLLAPGPRHGYQLRAEFEARTGGTWPLNVGQVYSTLQRLQRDGLVEPAEGADDTATDGRIAYRLTDTGRAEVDDWFRTPVDAASDPRDELAIKLALGIGLADVDLTALVQVQRSAGLRRLQELTRLKRDAGDDADLAWELVLDRLVFTVEAQLRWLDHVEGRLGRARARLADQPARPAIDTATDTAIDATTDEAREARR